MLNAVINEIALCLCRIGTSGLIETARYARVSSASALGVYKEIEIRIQPA